MRGEREQFVQAGIVIGAAMQLDAQPKALGEAFAEPGSLLVPMVVRQPDRQQAGERLLPRRLPGPHDTGQAAFVGDRQGPIAQACCTGEEFRGAGGAALETEVGQAMQFGVGAHANQPCSHSGPSLPTSR